MTLKKNILICILYRYKTMGRRQPINITYHPSLTSGQNGSSSVERLLDLIEEAGLEASLEREFESGDHHMMVGALAVVVLVSHEYLQTNRFQVATPFSSCPLRLTLMQVPIDRVIELDACVHNHSK